MRWRMPWRRRERSRPAEPHAWRSLPPLRPTLPPSAPVTTGTGFAQDVQRRLLLLAVPPAPPPEPVELLRAGVFGLVRPLPAAPAEDPLDEPPRRALGQAAPPGDGPRPRRVPAVAPPTDHLPPVLTHVDEPPSETPAGVLVLAEPEPHPPVEPPAPAPRAVAPTPVGAPAAPVRDEQADEAVAPPVRRRANLGETRRRLGLGPPIPAPRREGDGGVEPRPAVVAPPSPPGPAAMGEAPDPAPSPPPPAVLPAVHTVVDPGPPAPGAAAPRRMIPEPLTPPTAGAIEQTPPPAVPDVPPVPGVVQPPPAEPPDGSGRPGPAPAVAVIGPPPPGVTSPGRHVELPAPRGFTPPASPAGPPPPPPQSPSASPSPSPYVGALPEKTVPGVEVEADAEPVVLVTAPSAPLPAPAPAPRPAPEPAIEPVADALQEPSGEDRGPLAAPPLPPPAVEPIPAALRAAMLRTHGADLAAVRVRRDEVAERLTVLHSARAVTRDGEVFLPAHHGPLDRAPASGLLAHELVHVLQQRRIGPELPAESSVEGRRLEQQARAAEVQWHRDASLPTITSPATPATPPAPPQRWGRPAARREPAEPSWSASRVFLPAPEPTPAASVAAVQRADDAPVVGTPEPPSQPAVLDAVPAVAGDETAASLPPAVLPTPAAPVQIDDLDLDLLSRRLYERLRSKLRSELLVDRERAGLLSDLRR